MAKYSWEQAAQAKDTTRREINCTDIVEAGDLANEAGKDYMAALGECIERHQSWNHEKMWFVVHIHKDILSRATVIGVAALTKPLEYLRENIDLWEYNYPLNAIKLCWSLPHVAEMKTFLKSPERYSKDLIKWIKQYVKQEHINLKDDKVIKIENG